MLLALLSVFSGYISAQTSEEATALVSAKLQITPRICVLSGESHACAETLHFNWRAGMPLSVCLYRVAGNQMLECWQESETG